MEVRTGSTPLSGSYPQLQVILGPQQRKLHVFIILYDKVYAAEQDKYRTITARDAERIFRPRKRSRAAAAAASGRWGAQQTRYPPPRATTSIYSLKPTSHLKLS